MELSADSQPETEYDTSAAAPPRPTLLRNLGFWLLAMLVGLVLMLLFAVLAVSSSDKYGFGIVVLSAGYTTILSLAALPLLLPLLPWALTAPSVGLRWLRIFTLQSLSLGSLTALGYKLGGSDSTGYGHAAPLLGTIYFGAGLLAAAAVYWSWLRRPQ